jgi:hypothetical protein
LNFIRRDTSFDSPDADEVGDDEALLDALDDADVSSLLVE